MVSEDRLAVLVPAATDVQVAPAWWPLYHQAALWLTMVSVALLAVMLLVVSPYGASLRTGYWLAVPKSHGSSPPVTPSRFRFQLA